MRFQVVILCLTTVILSVTAGPVPQADFNAKADTLHAQLTESRDKCIHETGNEQGCVHKWHLAQLDLEKKRFHKNPEGSLDKELAKGRIAFHEQGLKETSPA